MSPRIGCVVLGPGRAGQARIRAIEAHPECELRAVVRSELGPGTTTEAAILADPEVDAVVVCTPNLLHVPQSQRALAAGKHVLVEFPLAPSGAAAAGLFERAQRAALVLHVGHIELLAPSQLLQRERAASLGRPVGGELVFSGGIEGWIGDPARAGTPALRAMARLHRLRDLFGPGRVRRAVLASPEAAAAPAYRLEVELEFERGGHVTLVESREPDAPRCTTWRVTCEHGVLDDPPPSSARGVFAEDFALFVDQIRGRAAYPFAQVERDVLDWIDAVDAQTAMRSAAV